MKALPPARLPFPITRATPSTVEARQDRDGDGMPTMVGHFSTFGDWYEVDSVFEGHFLERVGPRAFDKTISESRDQMKVLYDHGQDPQIGNKVLGPIEELGVDRQGPRYQVPLFDTSYNRDLAPGIEAGVYGSSFRFTVEKDDWDRTPELSDHNPAGLPERTITEARVFEFGPVTFPANPNATVGARSTTDTFYQRSRDPESYETLLRSAQSTRTLADAEAAAPPDEPPASTPEQEPLTPDTPGEPAPEEPALDQAEAPRSSPMETKYVTREDKAARVTELKESLESLAAEATGVLTVEQQARWDADNEELDALNADIAAWDKRTDRLAALKNGEGEKGEDRAPAQINRKSVQDIYSLEKRAGSFEAHNQALRDDAMRILEVTSFPHPGTDVEKTRDKIASLLDFGDSENKALARRMHVTGSPLYRRAFEKIVKGRGTSLLTPEEQRGTALAVGVDATGGFAVPFAFDPTVIAIGVHTGAVNPYRRACRVVQIVGTDTWNALTSTAVVATRTTEAAAATEQGPTFAQPQFIVKRVQGQITTSYEMLQDRTDLAAEMAVLIQEAKDNEEEASWATGDGSGTASIGVGPAQGTSGAFTGVDTAGASLAAADLDALEAALPVRHRFNAQWFMNRANIRRIQSLETTGGKLFGGSQYPSVGNPALDGAGNTGLRLLGYPVNESPSLPSGTAANTVIATLANVSQYVIVDRVGMSIQFIPFLFNDSALATGQAAIYFMYRNHAKPINVDGGRTLQYV
jgi:HK97 family phage major capsid protein/HK97 family phage prohead protease